MKAGQLIKILKQFDPEKRVVIDAGGNILAPVQVAPMAPSKWHRNQCTDAEFGDILIQACSTPAAIVE